jgi:hypothetical protein
VNWRQQGASASRATTLLLQRRVLACVADTLLLLLRRIELRRLLMLMAVRLMLMEVLIKLATGVLLVTAWAAVENVVVVQARFRLPERLLLLLLPLLLLLWRRRRWQRRLLVERPRRHGVTWHVLPGGIPAGGCAATASARSVSVAAAATPGRRAGLQVVMATTAAVRPLLLLRWWLEVQCLLRLLLELVLAVRTCCWVGVPLRGCWL